MQKWKLNEANIAKIKAGSQGETKNDYVAWDTELEGFGLRVRTGHDGKKRLSWIIQYQVHGKGHRMKLGDQATMTADVARSVAKKEGVKVDDSRRTGSPHPILEKKNIRDEMIQAEAKRPGDAPFRSRIEEYMTARTSNGNGLRDRSATETRRYLEQTFKPLHNMPLAEIRRIDVANVLSEIKQPAAHNRARSTLSTFFAWVIGKGWRDDNPVVGTIKAEGEQKRERTLTNEEIAAVWLGAATANGYGTILKLLLLTGCRRDEIGGLKWSEIDLNTGTITIPGSRTKNKQEHIVPLSAPAMEILAPLVAARREGREHVFGRTMGAGFSGWSSAKAEFDAAVKLADWVVHDLRRTTATQMAELGVLPHIIEACLNHISGHKGGVAGIYNRATYLPEKKTYLPEKKKALDMWAHHIKTIVAQATGANVTPLRKGEPRKPRR
jgi:integrase